MAVYGPVRHQKNIIWTEASKQELNLRKLPPCHSQTLVTIRWSVSLV
jgi:hypothetical protein